MTENILEGHTCIQGTITNLPCDKCNMIDKKTPQDIIYNQNLDNQKLAINKPFMTDKQTTWTDKIQKKYLKGANNGEIDTLDLYEVAGWWIDKIKHLIQEEREKVIAEFISGERCSDCGKLIKDGSSSCRKECWENN